MLYSHFQISSTGLCTFFLLLYRIVHLLCYEVCSFRLVLPPCSSSSILLVVLPPFPFSSLYSPSSSCISFSFAPIFLPFLPPLPLLALLSSSSCLSSPVSPTLSRLSPFDS